MNRSIIRFHALRWFAALFSVAFTMGLLALSIHAQTSVTDGRTPLGMAAGAPAGSYGLSGLDDINLFNGNLNFKIPLIKIGGRGSAGYTMTFRPNENRFKWRVVHNVQKSCNQNGCTVIAHLYYPSENWWATPETQPGYRPGILIGRKAGENPTQPGGCANGTSVWSSTLTRITFSAGDGTEYELRDQLLGGQPQPLPNGTCGGQAGLRGKVFVTGDGTAVTFISDIDIYDSASNPQTFYPSGYLLFRDGTRYRIDTGAVSWIRDRNGNRVSFSPGTITDSLNRVITYSNVITLKGFGGATRTIQVSHASLSSALRPCRPDPGYQCFSTQTYKQLFPGSDGSSFTTFNPTVVSALTLPDGRQYRFYYNSYAELARVDLPTGGTIEYDYAAGPGGDASGLTGAVVGEYLEKAIYRRVVERRVYADGQTLEGRTTYSTDTNPTVVDHLKPTGELISRSKHYFHGDPRSSFFLGSNSYGLWNVGREYKSQTFSNDGVTELRRLDHQWQQGCAVSSWSNLVPNNPRIAETISTLEPLGANRVSKEVFGYDCYNNLTDTYEHDFGNGVPATSYTRRTHTDYLTVNPVNGSSYDTLNPSSSAPDLNVTYHLRSLPKQVSIYDGGGVERARSTIEYDNYVLDGSDCAHSFHCPQQPRSNISGFDSAFTTSYTTRGNATSSTTYLLSNGVAAGSISGYSHYDVAGNVVRGIDPRSTPSNIIGTTIEYDDRFGTPNGEARANSAPVELGGQSTFAFASTTINPLNHQSFIQRDYYLGQAVDVEDANGTVSSSYFNEALDRPTQVVRALNGDSSVKSQTSFVYNDAAHLITTTSDQATHPDNILKTELVYDGLGRTIETRQYESGANYIAVQTQYDALGRAFKVSNPFRPQIEAAAWTITGFDALERVISITTPDSAVVKTAYDGNRVLVADQNSSDELRRKRVSVTDGLGRLKEVWEITAADSATESVTFPGYADVAAGYVTRYEYDALDNLTSVSQRVGVSGTNQIRFFEYDSLKRLTSGTNPESGRIDYQYDNNGNLVVKTDARVSTHFEYDAINRLKRRWYNLSSSVLAVTHNDPALPSTIGATNEARLYYDSQALPSGAPPYARGSATGRLVAQTYGTGSNGDYFGYDALGRPTVKIQQTGAFNYEIHAGYNLAGGITSLTYPSGHAISNSYDAAGLLIAFSGNLGDGTSRTYADNINYSPFGGLTRERFGTDTSIYHKTFYNIRGQLFDTRVSSVNDTWDWNRGRLILYYSSNHLWGESGTDNNGNVRFAETWIPPENATLDQAQVLIEQAYNYDALNRLTSVTEQKMEMPTWVWQQQLQQSYSYDRHGNRTINVAQTWGTGVNNKQFTVDASTNRLGVPNGQPGAMSYDTAGNLTNDTYTGAGYRTYDAENKITSASGGNNQAQLYGYDATGQRIKRTVNGMETWQVYGFGGELLAEYPVNGDDNAPQKEYGYRDGQLLITAEPPRTNVALAANGATASASSQVSTNYPAYSTINGDRRGLNWNNGGGWNDGTINTHPDWLQIDFNGSKTIDEIDVFTLQDNPATPAEPTESMTFTLYGLTGYSVQYWNGSAWTTVTGGTVTGNNKVWRKFAFAAITTTKIRVLTSSSPDAYSRITEVEAWGNEAAPARTNFALNGLTSASSTINANYPAFSTINGDRRGLNWNFGGGWNDATVNTQPDWLQIDFNGSKTIDEINVITLQDNPATPAEPTESMTFTLYGLTGYSVQYWNGSAWTTVTGGTVSGNNKVWKKFTFTAITTTKIRVLTSSSPDAYSRLTEVEAWGPTEAGTSVSVKWLVPDHLGTPRIIVDQTGSLAGIKRHDYLPFGEELFVGAGGRTVAMGYAADGVRQQFTQKERDIEMGLDYFLARYYSSTQGRFISPDEFSEGPLEISVLGSGSGTKQALPYAEITNPQSINKYQYVYNNPLRFIDPDGHQQDEKKGVVDQLLEYLGRIFKGQNKQDGMLPTSGDGEVRKREQNGPLDADPNRLTLNSWKVRAQQAQAMADVYEMADPTGIASFSRGWMEGDPNRMVGGVLQGIIKIRGTNIAFSEAKTLVGGWSRGTFAKVSETLDYHFKKHGFEVGAENLVQYMRKAAAFGRNLRGAQRTQLENGAVRYVKDGYYIIKDQAGKILSFGKNI